MVIFPAKLYELFYQSISRIHHQGYLILNEGKITNPDAAVTGRRLLLLLDLTLLHLQLKEV